MRWTHADKRIARMWFWVEEAQKAREWQSVTQSSAAHCIEQGRYAQAIKLLTYAKGQARKATEFEHKLDLAAAILARVRGVN